MARAGSIRGITVEIAGDTTKLGKALEDSETKSRRLGREMSEVNKLLQVDPSNVELLSQKQDILTQSVEQTTEKLRILREAEEQVQEQFQRGEITEEQYRAYAREIVATEQALDRLQTQLTETNTTMDTLSNNTEEADTNTEEYRQSVEDANAELEDFKTKASGAFGALATGATVLGTAVVALSGYAVNLSTEYDQALNSLIAKTGASSDEVDGLDASLSKIYTGGYGESVQAVADAMATVKNNTKLSGDQLERATECALLMSDTFDFDVNESTRSAKMLMDQYGLSAEDAYNLIVQGAQNGLDKNGDLLDTINEYSVHFESLGIGAEEMFNMLVNGADNGTFSVDKLGDAVKEFGIRTKDGSDATKQAFEALGLNADETSAKFANGGKDAREALSEVTTALFNMEDPLLQNQTAVALFGTMWEDLGIDGVKALMDMEGEISTAKDALEEVNAVKYDDIGSALEGLKRTLETDVIKPLGDELTPEIEKVIGYVQENTPEIKETLSGVVTAVGDFVGFIVDNGPTLLSVIAGIGAGMLVWNVASVINTVVGAIKAYQLANEGATIAQALFNAVLNANPIMLIVSLVAMIITAIVTFVATNEDAREKIKAVWEKIQEVAGKVIDALVVFFTETVPEAIGVVIEWFKDIPDKIKSGIEKAVEVAKTVFGKIKEAISTAINTIKSIISTVFETIKTIISSYLTAWKTVITTAWDTIKSVVSGAIEIVKTTISTVFETIKTIIETRIQLWLLAITTAWELIKTTVTNAVNGVKDTISNVFGIVKTTISNVMETIKTTISTVWGTIKETVKNTISGIKDVISNIFGAIKALLRGDMSSVKEHLSGAWSAIKGVISTVLGGIKSVISTVFSGIKTTIRTITGGIKDSISAVWTGIKTTTSNIFNGIKDVMTNAITNAKTTVVDACKNVFTGMKNAFSNIKNTFKDIGKNVIEGIKNGIGGAVSGLYNSIKDTLGGLVDKAKDALGIHSPSRVFADVIGKQIPAGIAMGVDNNADIASDAVLSMTDDLTDQANHLNGATIQRKLATTFDIGTAKVVNDNASLLSKLDGIYERLNRMQIVLDTGTLVGETIDKIDMGLANKQLLSARGV